MRFCEAVSGTIVHRIIIVLLVNMGAMFAVERRHRSHWRHIHFHCLVMLWRHIRCHCHCHRHHAEGAKQDVSNEADANYQLHILDTV